MTDKPLGTAIELTSDERAELEEGSFCAAGLRCVGLTDLNYPAHVGYYLEENEDGYEVGREAYGWRFPGDPLQGVYCEDCTIELEIEGIHG